MDDGDSPDELIKHKRMVPWEISDSDDDTDGSEEGESESSDEEGDDDDLEGEGGEDNEEEDDEDEEDGDAKTEDGVFGNTSGAILAMSSDEEADKCPICLNTFNNQPVATPENCEHYFCLDCILAWSKNANSCPVDRITFNSIYLRKSYGGKVQKMITVQKTVTEDNEVTVDMDLEQTNCEVCQSSDREDRLLLCDGCDAGYHMECLTPPLDTVPVEEWFCPECVVNTHNNSGSVEQQNQTQRLPSAVQPTTSRSQSRAAGPTRAIARTRHSERVRANVNQHRITQARTSQLAPAEQIQSNWLDETINAVVAGLNTAIYVRDLTSRVPTRRKRKTGTRRKATKKKPLSVKGRKGRSSRPRKKRKLRKSKSTKTLVGKKLATPRSRIANSLGLSKDKNNCSLPTVCRPSEHTLSSMRADIGAASLSIYGDPFDLDPFADRGGSEEDAQEETISSLLEAKRRGISHSAFRSHQPVARPVSAGMSRHGLEVPQARGVVEAAPVPDLLGSILSGQSLLLMDSSDVVISPDGSLTASRSAASLSTLRPILRKRSSSEESCSLARPVVSSSLVECFSSDHLICQDQISSDLPGPPQSNLNRPYSQCSSRVPSGVSRIQPPHYPDLPSRGRSCFQPHPTNRPSPSFGIQSTNGVSMCGASFSTSSSKARLPSQCHAIKAPTKPMWVDVDILPRIPKIKRDATNNSGTDKSNCNSSTGTNNSGMPETALVCFAGNKNREQDVGQQSNTDRQPQNQRAGSSQSSSNSYSISSNTASPSAPLCNSSVSSSSSSSISFRINATSWRSRRLIPLLPSASESSTQGEMTEKTDEAKKREEHREKQKLLAAHTAAGNKKEVNIYDPFNPTLSDTSSSDSEDKSLGSFIHDFNSVSSSASTHDGAQSKQKLLGVKTETHERDIVQEEPKSAHLQTSSRLGSCTSRVVKIKNDSILVDIKTDNHTALSGKSNREPGFADSGKNNVLGHSAKRCSGLETPCPLSLVPHCQDHLKTKEESGKSVISSQKNNNNSTGCGSFLIKVQLKEERDSDARSSPRDFSHDKKTFVPAVPSKEQHSTSSISECYRDKTRGTPVSNQGDREKKMDKDREKRSKSREGRARSSSESSLSSSPISTYKKRRQRSRSSSSSSSSSRECSSRKKHKDSSQERSDTSTSGRERRRVSKDRTHSRFRSRSRSKGRSKNQRRGRSRSKSRSRSPYRSRSKDRRKKHTHSHYDNVKARSKHNRRSLSRSRSRERSKVDGSSKSIPKTSVSLFSSPKYPKDTKNESRVSLSSVKEEKNPEVKENVSSPTIVTEVKREDESTDTMAISIGIKKEIQIIEVKKKRQQPIDMFQDSPTPSHTEKEETPSTIQVLQKEPFEEEMCETTKKDEICEIVPMKAEAFSSELTVMSHHTSGGRQESLNHFQHDVKTQIDQANTIELTVPTEQVPGFDEALCVDMMLDSLDYVTQEHAEDIGVTVKQEDVGIGVKQERKTETELPLTPSKVKVQGKRVTWNIIEPNGGQPDKSVSKLSLCKQTLKKEAACLPSSITTRQDTSGPESVNDSANKDMGTVPTGSGCQAYLKKLHMQERAIEEVKLAIKPFYQKRDINKEEYKEILRKAVQKVCHSKSGEINPVKVGNLVKAYVDKYKHARKHRKSETKPTKTADGP